MMTRLIKFAFLILSCLLVQPSAAFMSLHMIGGGVPTGGADPCGCPIASYQSCYTGDFSGEVRQICFNSGVGDKLGVDTGTIEVTTSFITITGTNEWLEFASASEDVIAGDVGTIWATIYVDVVTITGETNFFEGGITTNDDYIVIRVNSDGTLRGEYQNNDSQQSVISSASIVGQTSTRVMFTWDQPNDDLKVCVAASCVEDTASGITALGLAGPITQLRIGEEHSGLVSHTIRVSDITIFSTYNAADPAP